MTKRVWLLVWTVCAVLVFSAGALAQSPGRTAAEDDVFWESVSGCTDAVEVGLYIEEFGEEGRHVAAARACLEKLRKAVPDTAGKKTPSTEVERLLGMCEMHFAANRLTTGVGGTAVQCYLDVLSRDPANMEAEAGLRRVFGKYAAWARAALEKGNMAKARGHVEKLKGLNPEAPEVAELEGAITRLERQTAEEQEKAKTDRKVQEEAVAARKQKECDGWNTLRWWWRATPERVTECLRVGADPNVRSRNGNSRLHLVVGRRGKLDVATMLLEAGADLKARNRGGETPLHRAAILERNSVMIAALLEAGADPNAQDKERKTPLHRAAKWRWNSTAVSTLLEAGADPNIRDKQFETSLHIAAWNRNSAVTAALLKAGADPNARDEHGNTPLHKAAPFNDDPAVITALLKAGADPNARGSWDTTPLHQAANYNQNPAVAAVLLQAGADPNARDGDSKTPLDYALKKNNRAVADLLSRY